MLPMLVIALMAFVPSAQAAVTRDAAAKKALAALGTESNDDPVIVFGLPGTIRPRTIVSQAGPDGAAVAAAAGLNRFQRARTKRIRKAGATLRRADVLLRAGAEPTFFFFEDQGPHQAFEHPGRVVLVGSRTGKVRLADTRWVPLLDGKVPAFFASAKNYEAERFHVLSRPWSTKPRAASRARTRAAGDATPRQQVADALAAEKSCALRISDTLGDFFDFGRVDKTRARLGLFFEGLEKLNAGFISRRYTTTSGDSPIQAAQALIDGSGCKDLFLYAAGAGTKDGDIIIGMRPAPGGLLEWQVLTAAQLEGLVKANPSVTFKFLFDAPYTEPVNKALIALPNTVLLLAAGAPNAGSFTFLPEVLGPDGVIKPSNNPDQLLEYTNAILNGLEAFVKDPQEIATWLAGRQLGGPSMMSWMMARAMQMGPAWMFSSPLNQLKLPVMPTAPPPPPVLEKGSPVNHAPTPTTPAQPTNEDTPKAFTLTANDPDGDPLTFAITSQPTHGKLTGTLPNLVYTPDKDFDGTDSFTYSVSDNRGGSNSATVQIPVAPDNDAAAVTTLSSSAPSSFTEDGAAVPIDSGLTVSDPDNANLVGATVKILSGFHAGDELVFVDQNGITGTYNTGTGVLTLTGTATKANYQTALRSVKFDSTSQDPGTTRSIEYRAEDGGEAGVPASRQVTVSPVNDAPVVTVPGAQSATEDTDKSLSPSVGDVDAAGDDVKVDLGVDHGTLALSTVAGLTNVTGDHSDTVSLTGSLAEVNAALNGLTYRGHNNLNGPDTLTVAADDLGHNGSGGALTDSDTVAITVAAVNDAPAVSASPGATDVDEGVAKVIDGSVTVGDVDDTNIESATVAIASGFDSADALIFVDQSGISGVYDSGTGVLTLTGTASKSDYQAALRSVEFRTLDDTPAAARTIDFKVNDGSLDSATSTKSLNVAPVNDAPVGATNETTTLAYAEGDGAVTPVPNATFSDVDDTMLEGATVAIFSGYQSGEDFLAFTDQNGIHGFGFNASNGTLSLTGSATIAQYEAAIRSITFENTSDTPNTTLREFRFTASDGDADAVGVSRNIQISTVNDAPVNTVPGAQSATEDTTKTLSGGSAPSVADVDAGGDDVKVTVSALHGTITLNGANGASVDFTGSVADVNTKLDGVQYTPAADYSGSDTITLLTDDLGHNGAGGAKTDTDTIDVTITGDNDAPILTVPGAQTTDEDTGKTMSPSVDDPDAGTDDVKVDLSAAQGTLSLATQSGLTAVSGDGTGAVSLTGSLSDVNAALTNLLYMPASNYNGADSIGVTLSDLGHNGSGGAQTDTDAIPVTVTAVNDAPVNTVPGAQTFDEDTTKTFTGATALSVADADAGSDSIQVSLSVDHGLLTLSGLSGLTFTTGDGSGDTNVTFSGAPAAVNTALDGLQYAPDANYNGADTLTMVTDDLAHNPAPAKTDTDTVALTVSVVNDPPVNTVPGTIGGAMVTNEDTPLTFGAGNAVSVADSDAGGDDVKVTLSADHGTLTLATTSGMVVTGDGTGNVELTGSITEVNAALDGLQYAPALNYNGTDTLTMLTSDLGHTGPDTKTDTDTIAVTVDPVNDAPVATGEPFSTDEDTPLSKLAAAGVLANDTDVDGDTLNAVLMTGPGNASSFTLNPDGSFDYTPNADFKGSDSFTYKANDGALDSNTVTVSLTINSINDAPVNSVPGTQTINEDSNLVLSGGNAPSIADVDDGGSNMTLTLGVAHGTLTLGGTSGLSVTGNGTGSVSATGSKSDLNTALSGLTYNPTANFDGADAISMKSEDNGNTGAGGNKSDTDSIIVNVTGVNDGPVNSVPGSQTTAEDTVKTFSTANSNKFSFDDSDSGTDTLTITVTTTNGTSTLSGTTGLTGVTGNGTSSISATGTESALNTALDGLVFTPTADYFGPASVELLTDDNGHNGTGGNLTDDDTVSITVSSVNDAPIAFAPTTQSTDEDTQLVFSAVPSVTDVDSGADDVEVILSVTNGTLQLSQTTGLAFQDGTSDNSGSMKFRGTTSAVNAALNGLKFTPTGDFTGPASFSISVDDLGHNGSGGPLTSNDTTAITVGPVNDAPALDLNGGGSGTSTNPTFLEVLTHDNSVALAPSTTITDIDDANIVNATVTLTNPQDGSAESLAAVGTSNITVDAYNPTTHVLFLHSVAPAGAPKSEFEQVLQTVSYANTQAVPDATDRSITFVVNDGDADSNIATSTVQVVPLNTPPVVDLDTTDPSFDSEATFTEDSPAVNIAPNPSITDADAADTHMESASIKLNNRPDGTNESLTTDATGTAGILVTSYDATTGILALDGHGTIADYETLISRIKYDNTSENPDTTDRDITVVVSDGQASSTTRHAVVHVTRHNDQIVNTVPGGQAFAEDTTRTFNDGNSNKISIADADAGSGAVKVTVSADHGSLTALQPSGGTRSGAGTHSLELTGTVSAINAVLDGMDYSPDANYNGSDTITVLSDDQGNSGGTATTDSDTIAITLSAVNDAPQNTVPGAQSVNEDTQLAFSSGSGNQISTADVDAGSNPVKVTLEVAHGTLTMGTTTDLSFTTGDGNNDPKFVFTGTLANVNAGLNTLSYQGSSNYNGPDTLTMTTDDQGNTGSGGALSDTDAVGITVNPVNDAPVATNDTYGTNEDTQLNVPAPGVLNNDTDIDSGSLTAVKVTDPANGDVTLNADGSFTYDPDPNFNGADSFTYKANDGSLDSNTVTVNLTIAAVNDAPSNTVPGSQTVDEDTTLTFNSGNGNLLSTSDVDAGSSPVQVTVAALHGKLTTNGLAGLSFSVGDGIADTTMTFTGTVTNVNTALNGLQYLGNLNYNGPEQITLTVNDQGATGAGGAKQDSDVINVTVNPVNDNPVAGDETFNATNSAIGNTTLNVNDTATTGAGAADGRPATPDPTDTSPTTDRPHKEITGNIFANDTDVDNNSNEFTAVPGTFATNDGGTVTMQSDGDFNFEPAPATSCTDTSDFFDYTVSDNVSSGSGPNPGTDTGRVVIAITGCVWYVNNNDAQGNSGTSEKPFDTTAQAQTASTSGHTTFVYDGDDTTTGYNTGYTMNTNESLISEGATLTIGSDTLHSADAANKASITNNNADVVTLAGGATVKSFNIDPQGTGGGIFGTGLGATTITLDDLNIVDNGTKGTQPGLELDTNTGTTTNVSNFVVNNGDGSSATFTDRAVRLNSAGTVNFASTGTISLTTNGAAALNGASTSLGSASTFDDITVTNSGSGGVDLQAMTGSGTAFGDGSGTDLSLTTVSGSFAGFSVQTAGSFSIPSGGQSDVSATGGPAVDVTGSSGSNMAWDSVSSTNSANDGINLDGLGIGTFSATSGTVGGESGTGFDLNGGSGAITYPATFNNGTGPLVAEITGRSGGVVSLAGSMNDTNDAGGGVNIASNTGGSTVFSGATKQYNTGASDAVTFSSSDGHTFVLSGGGTDIDTTSGNGVNASTSGTFRISGSGNTLDSTALSASNRGLNISDTDIDPSDVTFDHINTSGGANGIRLNNTGSAGNLVVTGTGGTCTNANTTGCSGGVIQNTTGADDGASASPIGTGIALNNTRDVSLTRMHVHDNTNYGMRGNAVTNLSMVNSVFSGTNGTSTLTVDRDMSMRFTNLFGTVAMTDLDVSGGLWSNLEVINTGSGTLNATLTRFNSLAMNQNNGASNAVLVEGTATTQATTNLTMIDSSITSARGSMLEYIGDGAGSNNLTLTNNDFVNGNPLTNQSTGGGGLALVGGATGSITMNLSNNVIRNAKSNALTIIKARDNTAGTNNGTFTINNNDIGCTGNDPTVACVTGPTDSGSSEGDGMELTSGGDGNATWTVTNNEIRQYNSSGMQFVSGLGIAESGQNNINISGNSIANPGTNGLITLLQGIRVDSGVDAGDTFSTCVDFGPNSITGSSDAANKDFRLVASQGTTLRQPGYLGGATDGTAFASFAATQIGGGAQGTAVANSPGTFANSLSGTACP
jgi:VCBS repeat-containing protein